MEGRVHICSWKRAKGGYDVWVKNRPRLKAHADDFGEADDALYEVILQEAGDGENVREYDPPRPDALEGDGLLRRFKQLGGNAHATIQNPDELWTGGVCPVCRLARGERTEIPVIFAYVQSGAEGALAAFKGPRMHFYSERFLAALKPAERKRFEWRAVEQAGSRKKKFFEITASSVTLPPAAFKEQYVGNNLFRCEECGGVNEPVYGFEPPTPGVYVSEDDVPRNLGTVFTIGKMPGPEFLRDRGTVERPDSSERDARYRVQRCRSG
jgi:hypothetical protein